MTARRALGGSALAVLAAGALAGCGGSHPHRSTTTSAGPTETTPAPGRLTVTPAHPTERTAIAFAFTAPVTSGVHGTTQLSYSLSVTGPAGGACVSAHEAVALPAAKGQRVSLSVGPTQLGGAWCPGSYTARAIELERPVCTGSAPCPQYIRVVGIVARGGFHVSPS